MAHYNSIQRIVFYQLLCCVASNDTFLYLLQLFFVKKSGNDAEEQKFTFITVLPCMYVLLLLKFYHTWIGLNIDMLFFKTEILISEKYSCWPQYYEQYVSEDLI